MSPRRDEGEPIDAEAPSPQLDGVSEEFGRSPVVRAGESSIAVIGRDLITPTYRPLLRRGALLTCFLRQSVATGSASRPRDLIVTSHMRESRVRFRSAESVSCWWPSRLRFGRARFPAEPYQQGDFGASEHPSPGENGLENAADASSSNRWTPNHRTGSTSTNVP